MIKRLLALAVGLLALSLAGCDKGEPTYQGWIEANLIFVGPDEVGRVETLSGREGDKVEAGAPLFTVDVDLQQADVMLNEAFVKNAQQAYDRSGHQHRPRGHFAIAGEIFIGLPIVPHGVA